MKPVRGLSVLPRGQLSTGLPRDPTLHPRGGRSERSRPRGMLKGIGIGGLGVGGSRIRGAAIGGVGVGGEDIKGIVITPGMFKVVNRRGRFQGVAINGISQIKGRQDGWTIGVVNYARDLGGVQIGLINIARSNPKGTRVLPLFNADFGK